MDLFDYATVASIIALLLTASLANNAHKRALHKEQSK